MTNGKTRFAFIDQFRGWAVIFMIETHVLNTFLHKALYASNWFKAVDFFNGLIAPSFLFLAGFSFGIISLRKWDELGKCGPAFWRQLGRYGQILAIGYCLHIPHYSFKVLFSQLKWNETNLFWGVDILHTIAVSLILMLLFVPLLRRRKMLFFFIAAAAALISLFTPTVYHLPVQSLVAPAFAGYLKRILWSQFPLFPWAGYVFFGAFFSYLWQQAREKEKEKLFFSYIAAFSGISVFVLTLTLFRPLILTRGINPSPVFPLFFFIKLGLVLMMLALFRWLEDLIPGRIHPVTLIGRESLLAYTFHIVFIYGAFWRWGRYSLSFIIGKTRTPLEIAAMALALIGLTAAACLAWHKLKVNHARLSRRLYLAFWGGMFLFFAIH